MGQKLWGITAGAENMPNWLTEKQKKNTFADKRGWVLRHNSGIEETLVSISALNVQLGSASPALIYWDDAEYFTAQSGRAVYVTFNEKVNVTAGAPTIVLTGGSSVTGYTIVHGGSGYTTAAIEVTGDGGQAHFTPVITDGVITGVTVNNAGSGYRTITLTVTGDGEGAEITAALGTHVTVTATYDSVVGAEHNTLKFLFTAPNNEGDSMTVLAQSISGGTIVELGTVTAVDRVITADIEPTHKQIIWD